MNWVVRVNPSSRHDGAWISIPEDVLNAAHWSFGDDIEISVTPSGAIVLMRPKVAEILTTTRPV